MLQEKHYLMLVSALSCTARKVTKQISNVASQVIAKAKSHLQHSIFRVKVDHCAGYRSNASLSKSKERLGELGELGVES